MNSSINPISLNKTFFEDCSECIINITFSGNDLTVDGLEFDFLGSWNYTAIAHFDDGSTTFTDTKIVQVYYSNFNVSLPKGVDWYNAQPGSKDSKNVTPYKQIQNTPIWNVSNLAYDREIDFYLKTNETINSCLNITYSNSSNRIEKVINESFFWNNGTITRLDRRDLINGSGVVFNQTDGGTVIGSNNYTIDYADGTITLNSSITANTTRINQSISITLDSLLGNENSSALEFTSLGTEAVRNGTAPFALLNPDVDYIINEANKNFTLVNETFNATILFVTYNYSTYSSYTDGEQFGINYSYFIYGYDSTKDYTFALNTSYQKFGENISIGASTQLWNWNDYNNCTNRFEESWFYWSAICSGCYFDEAQLDNYNIIVT